MVVNGWLMDIYIPGWWLTYPSEKYESVGMMTFPTEWKNKIHVPNQKPDIIRRVTINFRT
jgi:hypothetical protein